MYSGGMSQYAADMEQENLSGLNGEAYFAPQPILSWHEKNRELLNGFDKVRPIIKGVKNDKTGNNECAKTPF